MRKLLVPALTILLLGCGASNKTTQPIVNMTAKTWTVVFRSTSDPNIATPTATISAEACTTNVTGPMCFQGTGITNTSNDTPVPAPVSLEIGVPVNPVPISPTDGEAFNVEYVFQNSAGTWDVIGAGRFYPNGNVAGTWQCTTGACAGLSGSFTASQP